MTSEILLVLSAALLAATASASTEQMTSNLIFIDGYTFESSGGPYTQKTAHGTRIECSAVCQKQNCSGMSFDRNTTVCTIYPSIDRVVIGSGNMYMRAGKLIEMLAANGYTKIGTRYVNVTVKDMTYSAAKIACASTFRRVRVWVLGHSDRGPIKVFGFGTLFVPKSVEEMVQAAKYARARAYKDMEMWVGLDDAAVERTLKWIDGTAYTGLFPPSMIWESNDDQKDNDANKDFVQTKLKLDNNPSRDKWECKFEDSSSKAKAALCEVHIFN